MKHQRPRLRWALQGISHIFKSRFFCIYFVYTETATGKKGLAHACVCACMPAHTCMHAWASPWASKLMLLHLHACLHAHAYAFACVLTHMRTHMHAHLRMHVYACVREQAHLSTILWFDIADYYLFAHFYTRFPYSCSIFDLYLLIHHKNTLNWLIIFPVGHSGSKIWTCMRLGDLIFSSKAEA